MNTSRSIGIHRIYFVPEHCCCSS